MTRRLHLIVLVSLAAAGLFQLSAQQKQAPKPLRALLIAGGCCHDYAKQHEILSKGIQARANVQVDVVWTDDKSTTPPLPLYDNADWAKGYDIIIHDECAAGNNDKAVLQRILDAHKTIPAVHLHCAMHSFRTGTDAWFKHLGLQSAAHGPQEPIAITFVDKEHPVTRTLADWTTIKEELYNNINVFDAHPLAMGRQMVKNKDGSTREDNFIVAWINENQGARSFSTTIGHNNETVADVRYLDIVTRGLLWACDKLTTEYLVPFTGENTVTFVKAKPAEAPKTAAAPPAAPKDATLVTVTASSEESGKSNFAWKAVDGSADTRWCASNASQPQWFQLEFEKPQTLTGCGIAWESRNNAYQHKVEASTDGKAWTTVADASQNKAGGDSAHTFAAKDVRFVKITCLGTNQGGWASIREVSLKGAGIKALAPKTSVSSVGKSDADPYKNEGNIAPRIEKLTAAQEAAILKDVTIPDGFEATVFAAPPAVNYPVFVAAAPDGTLYVSSDGNGSLGRNPHRGRIIRLRDTDNDGRADETKVFCEVDAPRGLVWDHDRLYVVHPPDLSVYIDKNGDGVSDEEKVLVKGIAFGYDQRPADHTTNGLSLGIDGWLYIAGGDFGFMDAVGTDGRHLQHRGGGVIRVRPDGTGLEIYSTGTRNILEVAISPLMDIFARDNTNDGGGWNVRFHHFTGGDDHGYPRLFKNFSDECIQPLADYGGGSGCGACYIDEPGFGKWNNAPFTADWGTGALWHHTVKPKGATFEETEAPKPFVKMTRPTDADVDAMSRVYCASWKGATFNWEGPDVGYVVCVKPKGWTLAGAQSSPGLQPGQPPQGQTTNVSPSARGDGLKPITTFLVEPLPDFAKASDAELVKLLESPSNRRRMEAQRELVRRTNHVREQVSPIAALIANDSNSIGARAAAIYAIARGLDSPKEAKPSPGGLLRAQSLNPTISRLCVRALGEIRSLCDLNMLKGQDAATRRDAVVNVARFMTVSGLSASLRDGNQREVMKVSPNSYARSLIEIAGDPDPIIGHAISLALAQIGAVTECLDALSTKLSVRGSATVTRALAMIHIPEVVTGLITRLGTATDPELRKGILAALCRLHFHEGEWKGDSWGTRPDTTGPYYQPEPWEETPKIAAALKDALAKASAEEAAFLVNEMTRNRIQSDDALNTVLTMAAKDPKLIPAAVGQLAKADHVPAAGVAVLVVAVERSSRVPRENTDDSRETRELLSDAVLAQAIIALSKTDAPAACTAALTALPRLARTKTENRAYAAARDAYLTAPKLENHHQLLEKTAAELNGDASTWADACLLNLAARKTGSPESREMSAKALEEGWTNPKRRLQMLAAMRVSENKSWAGKVLAATDDSDKEFAKAAEQTTKALRIEKAKPAKDDTPLLSTMKLEAIVAAVMKTHGDVKRGEQIFTQQTCVACHTTTMDQPQKGPYLGNIAQTYKRNELAENILNPNKTIAQGFQTNLFTLKDGTQQMGFVVQESADKVTVRNIAAQELTYNAKDIAKRERIEPSLMPPGLVLNITVRDFASLLDYLEALSKK